MKKIVFAVMIICFSNLNACHECVGMMLRLEDKFKEIVYEKMKEEKHNTDFMRGVSVGTGLALRAAAKCIDSEHQGYRLSDDEYRKLYPELLEKKGD